MSRMVGGQQLGDGGLEGRGRRSVVLDSKDDFRLPSAKELERIVYDREEGTSFGWFDRLFMGWDEGLVFRYTDWECRDLAEMLRRDYRARQIESVLTYPTLRSERVMSPAPGDKGEAEWLKSYWDLDPLNGGCETPLDLIIDQMTSSVVYKKAFWEIVWTRGRGDFKGKSVYKRVAWRPQTTTRSLHDPNGGKIMGFQQEPYMTRPGITRGIYPIELLGTSQWVHVHGGRRDPINGVSDLEICYWAYKTKQKILYLLVQFLTGVARPDTLIKSQDVELSKAVARQINASQGGVIPVGVDGKPDGVVAEILDRSGKGAEQYMSFIQWLDSCAINAVMAGFLDLPTAAANGRGSHALSSDASDFFLMTLEHKNREYEYGLRAGLFAPLVRYNLGPSAKVPLYKFEPLNAEDKSRSIDLLNTLITAYAQQPQLIPDELPMMLSKSVGDYLGMDGSKLSEAFRGIAKAAADAAAKANAAAASPAGQQVAKAAGAVGAATRALNAGKAGRDPVKAAKGK